MRILLTVQYLGTHYAGWQAQANATGVQQVVEEALGRVFGCAFRIHGAGRTDSGVHATGQRAHFDPPFAIAARGLILGVNQYLPHDVRVIEAEEVAETFHSRFDAKSKTYAYRIWNASYADVFTFETHAHIASRLDETLMREAAAQLLGEHDFAPFTVADPEVSSTVRTLARADVVRDGSTITLTVKADGFLRYMVRRIAGSLIEVGRGKLDSAMIMNEARWTAPAKGLTLLDVGY